MFVSRTFFCFSCRVAIKFQSFRYDRRKNSSSQCRRHRQQLKLDSSTAEYHNCSCCERSSRFRMLPLFYRNRALSQAAPSSKDIDSGSSIISIHLAEYNEKNYNFLETTFYTTLYIILPKLQTSRKPIWKSTHNFL